MTAKKNYATPFFLQEQGFLWATPVLPEMSLKIHFVIVIPKWIQGIRCTYLLQQKDKLVLLSSKG
jgi:hypothetical protein